VQFENTVKPQKKYSLYTACPQNARRRSIMAYYSRYWANISEIFTSEFSTHLYIVCKNKWKFNVKIIFYYTISITRQKQKFP